MNLRNILVLAALTTAVAAVPAPAMAKQSSLPDGVYVCNTANSNGTGDLSVITSGDYADPQGAMGGNDSGLTAKKNGNLNAALHSPALALCGPGLTGGGGNY